MYFVVFLLILVIKLLIHFVAACGDETCVWRRVGVGDSAVKVQRQGDRFGNFQTHNDEPGALPVTLGITGLAVLLLCAVFAASQARMSFCSVPECLK